MFCPFGTIGGSAWSRPERYPRPLFRAANFMSVNPAFISFKNITKRFPGVLALDDVSFDIARGSCHALMGENGAGKSTLGKILAGVYVADTGAIHLDGKPVHAANPLAARKLGIAMVHQELAFCPDLTVAENLCLGQLPATAGWLDRHASMS